jgi:hypothetical protein
MDDANVEPNEWCGWQKFSSKKKCRKIWLHTKGVRPHIENIYLPLRKPFHISFIVLQTVQDRLV